MQTESNPRADKSSSPEFSPRLNSLWRSCAIASVIAGLVCAAFFLAQLNPPLHIAGDGMLKQYQIETWLEHGGFPSMTIRWPQTEPWVEQLWAKYHPPFDEPFITDGKLVFPPLFLILSTPFYAALGYYGLFILPLLGLLALWFVLWRTCRGMNLSIAPSAIALTGLILSPLYFFGLMFWEHTPALFVLALAVYIAFVRQESQLASAAAGFLIGLAVWLRAELVIAGVALLVYFVANRPRRPIAFAGLAVAVVGWAALNWISTGTPFGIHGQQPRMIETGDPIAQLLTWYADLGLALLRQYTFETFALIGSIVAIPIVQRDRPERIVLIAMTLGTLVLLPFVIPYEGVIHGFRRFELVIVPAGALLAALLIRDWPRGRLLLPLAILVRIPALIALAMQFLWAHGEGFHPVHEKIRERQPAAVVADSQFPIIGLATTFEDTPLLWAPPPDQLLALLQDVSRHVDLHDVLVVIVNPPTRDPMVLPLPAGDRLLLTPITGPDTFNVAYEVLVLPRE